MTSKPERVIAIIRGFHRPKPCFWATLRKVSIYDSKCLRDDAHSNPDYTWCMDTECAPSVSAAKQLARDYSKKLGVRIARFCERL